MDEIKKTSFGSLQPDVEDILNWNDFSDDDWRVTRLYGRRYENNNAGCIGRKCCRDLSPA